MEKITQDNYINYAVNNYISDSKLTLWQSFFDDLKIFSGISRLLIKYKNKNITNLNLHSLLNSFLILRNIFKEQAFIRLSYFTTKPEVHSYVTTILYALGTPREKLGVPENNHNDIDSNLLFNIANNTPYYKI